MSEVVSYLPGDFCWTELFASSPTAVRPFYERLFGWTYRELVVGSEPYIMCMKGERVVAALRPLSADPDRRSCWRSYIAVASCDLAAREAEALGASTISEPSDVGSLGRTALLRDPSGAAFAVWEPKEHRGAGCASEPGTMCWNELATLDFSTARRFYTNLFGWTSSTGKLGARQYLQFSLDGAHVAAMVALSPRAARLSSLWLVYFAVADCDEAASVVSAQGGRVTVPPIDVPGVGRFCAVRDPVGTLLALIQLSAA